MQTCAPAFAPGAALGDADPFGSGRGTRARAARLTDISQIVQPAHARQRIQVGDFVLVNDKLAVTIEDVGLSDGYNRFGGSVIAVDRMGADDKPSGVSTYLETLLALSNEILNAQSVTIVSNGADGGPALIRAIGKLEPIAIFDGALKDLFPNHYGLDAAIDYALAPGEERLKLRLGVRNTRATPIDFSLGGAPVSDELHGFFASSQGELVTPEHGFDAPSGSAAFVGFVSGAWNFAWRGGAGRPLHHVLDVLGFQEFSGPGFTAPPCETTWVDIAEIIAGGPEYDGLREAVRRVDAEPAWRTITGVVRDAQGAPVSDAWIQERDGTGNYLSRARSTTDGSFSIHAPPSAVVDLIAQVRGLPLTTPVRVAADDSAATLVLGPSARVHVTATDTDSGAPLPVRIQVIPESALPPAPAEFGVLDELEGRLYQEFAATGSADLAVFPGQQRVVVSRGYEYELTDEVLTLAAGESGSVNAELTHSVDSTGYMCADFHMHTQLSADSSDPVDYKVRGAVADGLDILVSSEHDWVLDFQPTVKALGLEAWAFGMPSEELTTFEWGHFGVIPLSPRPEAVNNGALDWVGRTPQAVFDAVRALPDRPVLVVNHPRTGGFQAYFSAAKFDDTSGIGTDSTLWTNDFDAIEVFNQSDFETNRGGSVADWFSLLNHGMTFWATGASDSHQLRTTPAGYPRTCLHFGHDDPTLLDANAVRDMLARGHATVSGGLFMTVAGPGGAEPGDSVPNAPDSVTFTVRVQAASWVDATSLETIVNGVSVGVEPLLPLGNGVAKQFVNQVIVSVERAVARSWVVFHARGDAALDPLHPKLRPFAVSNPVFLAP